MRITIIGDTHGQHERLGRLSGDVLIHCGDIFNMYSARDDDRERIDDWFGRQAFSLILCIGGNHGFPLVESRPHPGAPFRDAIHLADSSYVHQGVHFYGAPWIPGLPGQAFFRNSDDLKRKWAEIPADLNVLITHTPPAGVLDVSSRKLNLGCDLLAERLGVIAPRLHCFGHVHASSRILPTGTTTFVNASMVNSQCRLTRRPYHLEL